MSPLASKRSRAASARKKTEAAPRKESTTSSKSTGWGSVYRAVKRIPTGKVSTYGAIAELAGMPRAARQVGWALNALGEEDDVPWHRVINSRGEISARGERAFSDMQRAMLEAEGVKFDRQGRVSLAQFGWTPRRRRTSPKVSPGERA